MKILSYFFQFFIAINFSDDSQVVVSSSDPVSPVGHINFTKLHLEQKHPIDYRDYVIKTSLDFVSELNTSSHCDLSDPDLTDTELEFIDKEHFGKLKGSQSHPGAFIRSKSLNSSIKNNSMEENFEQPPEKLIFEYEKAPLLNEPHVVANSKGWHWISGIQGGLLSIHQISP